MAIAFDSKQNPANTTATTLTFAHTCTGDNLILFVCVMSKIGADVVTGVTYAGTAMTFINSVLTPSTNGRYLSMWYLISPATGANNVVVTNSESSFTEAASASYTGAKQSAQPDAQTVNSDTSASDITTTITTIADNCWGILFVKPNDGTTVSATSGVSARAVLAGGGGIYDTNAPKTPAGSLSGVMHRSANCGLGVIFASFAPVAASGPANLKSWNGLAKASIKSINSLAIASIKSVNSLA